MDIINIFIEWTNHLNKKLNSVIKFDEKSAEIASLLADIEYEDKHSLLMRIIPFTVKDTFDTKGIVSSAGTSGRRNYVPREDATVVGRLKEAGAVLLGKSNTPELAVAFETDNLIFGRTNNPYDISRTPGGSGGGGAATVAAGGVVFDVGSDTGGSIRVPAHFCGIAGIKPSAGLIPITGHFPPPMGQVGALTQVGLMAKHVEDLILIFPIISGPDGLDPDVVPIEIGDPSKVTLRGLRAAVYTDNGLMTPASEIMDAVISSANHLARLGVIVEEILPSGIDQTLDIWLDLTLGDGGERIRTLLKMAGTTELHPWTQQLLDISCANVKSASENATMMSKWYSFRKEMMQFMDNYDLIISPVCAFPALPHGATYDEEMLPAFSYTMTFNLTGWPAAVVRVGSSSEGLPIGVQIVARPFRDDLVLATLLELEKAFGGWQKPPLFNDSELGSS